MTAEINGKPNSDKTTKECEQMIERSFRHPMVKFLREKLAESGCVVRDNFFHAIHCEKYYGGGFIPGSGIVVCSNHMWFQDHVTQTIIHELIHAFDECRASNLKWNNCVHHACAEIRAAHLSGDCHLKRELLRGIFKIRGHEPECVSRRALKALSFNPHCSDPEVQSAAMHAAWNICYNDSKPFEEPP